MNTALAAVEAFVAAWNRMDFDAVIAALAPDVVYHNIPLEPLHGRDAVAAYLRDAWVFTECEWELVNAAANANTVLTERVDRFVIDGRPVVLPVMGTFELRDGAIVAWRDYFDLASYRAQMAAPDDS